MTNSQKGIFEKACDGEDRCRTCPRHHTQKFLTSIFDNLPDMIFVKDAEELRFVDINKAGEKLIGFTRNELLGKNDYDFFPKEQADFFTSKDKDVLAGKSVVDILGEPIDTKEGTKILHTKKVPILGDNGKPRFLLGISRDITELKQVQEENLKLQSQLQEYTKHLEHKVRHLETGEIGLNKKEKLVIAAVTNYPLYTDQQLAKVTELKRSTITSIRNRLKRDRWYKIVTIPSLQALGLEYMHIMFKENPKQKLRDILAIKKSANCFYALESPQCSIFMCAYKDLREAHNTVKESLKDEYVRDFMTGISQSRFLAPTSEIYEFFNFGPMVNHLFGFHFEQNRIEPKERKLSKNEQEILYALIKYPEADNEELQAVTRLSKPTIIKIKRLLYNHGLVQQVVLPNLAKLGLVYGSIIHKEVKSPNYDLTRFRKILSVASQTFLGVVSVDQFIGLSAYRNYDLLEHVGLKQSKKFQESLQTLRAPNIIHFRDAKVHKFSFAELIKEYYNLKVDY